MRQLSLVLDAQDATELAAPKVNMAVFQTLVRTKAIDLVQEANEELNNLARSYKDRIIQRLNSSQTLSEDITDCIHTVSNTEMHKNIAKENTQRARTNSGQSTVQNDLFVPSPTFLSIGDDTFSERSFKRPGGASAGGPYNAKAKLKLLVSKIRSRVSENFGKYREKVVVDLNLTDEEEKVLNNIEPVEINETLKYVLYQIERLRI